MDLELAIIAQIARLRSTTAIVMLIDLHRLLFGFTILAERRVLLRLTGGEASTAG